MSLAGALVLRRDGGGVSRSRRRLQLLAQRVRRRSRVPVRVVALRGDPHGLDGAARVHVRRLPRRLSCRSARTARRCSPPRRSSCSRPSISRDCKFGIGTQVWLLWRRDRRHAGRDRGRRLARRWPGRRRAPRRRSGGARGPVPRSRSARRSCTCSSRTAAGATRRRCPRKCATREHGMKRALIVGMSLVTRAVRARELGVPAGPVARRASRAARRRRRICCCYAFGTPGQALIVAIVALTSITSMNAIMIAGARTTYAAARDTAGLDRLGALASSRAARRRRPSSRSAGVALGARRVRRLHARRFLDDGRLSVAGLLAVSDAERHRVARAAAPLSRRARGRFACRGIPWVPLVFIASSFVRAVLEPRLRARWRGRGRRRAGRRRRVARGVAHHGQARRLESVGSGSSAMTVVTRVAAVAARLAYSSQARALTTASRRIAWMSSQRWPASS